MPKVTIGDETHEIEPDAIQFGEDESPDGFVPQESVDGIIQKRLGREQRKTLEGLGLDPTAFKGENGYELDPDRAFQRLAEEKGIPLRDDGKPKGTIKDEELEELRRQASKVETLSGELEQLRAQRQETQRTQLENKVYRHADNLQEGAQDDFMASVERQMMYDDDYGWVATDQDGNVRYSGGEPVRVESVIDEMREQKPYFFQGPAKNDGGPGFQGSGGGQPSGGVTKSELRSDLGKKAKWFEKQRAEGRNPQEAYENLPEK